jgi:hypothetical protein
MMVPRVFIKNSSCMKTLLILLICLAAACKETEIPYPKCVQTVIDNGSNDYEGIRQYTYNNKTVYLFTTKRCCDFLDYLYDDCCNELCAPSGGISGRGDNRCPDFKQNAQLVRLVWGK